VFLNTSCTSLANLHFVIIIEQILQEKMDSEATTEDIKVRTYFHISVARFVWKVKNN
jgi:hypothetical protein